MVIFDKNSWKNAFRGICLPTNNTHLKIPAPSHASGEVTHVKLAGPAVRPSHDH